MIPWKRGFRVFLLGFSLWGWIFVLVSLAFGASAEVGFVVRGDGGVEVTVSGRMESCTQCNSWGECWVQDRGRVVLAKGNRVLCSAEGQGWVTCMATLDRGDLHGAHIFDGSAGDCQGTSGVRKTLTLDNTPSLDIASPAGGGILAGPFDVRAKAVFKPTLSPVKGEISVGLQIILVKNF